MDIFEAVRGHLTGPGRDGRFEVREDEDRWVLEFAPCGSGGRTYPTAEDESRDPREFTTEEHDWAWRTVGVCLYCVHCRQLQQRAPIEVGETLTFSGREPHGWRNQSTDVTAEVTWTLLPAVWSRRSVK